MLLLLVPSSGSSARFWDCYSGARVPLRMASLSKNARVKHSMIKYPMKSLLLQPEFLDQSL
jgi:hypothetical protein